MSDVILKRVIGKEQEITVSLKEAEYTLKRQMNRRKRNVWVLKDANKYEFINGELRVKQNKGAGKKPVQS